MEVVGTKEKLDNVSRDRNNPEKKKKGKKENKWNGSLFTTIAILQSYSRLPAINVH